MTLESYFQRTPRVNEALGELEHMITKQHPDATFVVEEGFDLPGVYLVATVDVPETDLVFEIVVDRLIDMRVEEGLPVYVVVLRPIERVIAELHHRESRFARLMADVDRVVALAKTRDGDGGSASQ